MVFSLYSIVDGLMVAKGVGEYAMAAVNLAVPFTNVLFSIGVIFAVACKRKYQERFGTLALIISDEGAAALQSSDEEISVALDRAIDDAINKILAEHRLTTA